MALHGVFGGLGLWMDGQEGGHGHGLEPGRVALYLCACNMSRYVHDADDFRSILTAEIKLINSRY
jgi:hypothetical protein